MSYKRKQHIGAGRDLPTEKLLVATTAAPAIAAPHFSGSRVVTFNFVLIGHTV